MIRKEKDHMKEKLFRIFGTLTGITLVILFFTKLLLPTWPDWNIDNTMKGIYREPGNRIQVLFVGMSGVVNGISPMKLYNDYGLCAYDMGSPQQPMLASYYWIREVERLHPKSLSTVVLDVSSVFDTHYSYAFAEKSLAHMKLSPVKLEAVRACDEEFEEFHFWDYIFPLTTYHSRWSQLTRTDFRSLTEADNYFYSRGQNISYVKAADNLAAENILVPSYQLTVEQEHDADDHQKAWDRTSLRYFNRIAEFCQEKHLNLVLISIPKLSTDREHDAMQYLADQYGVPFIDFNLPDIQEEIGLNFAFDYVDRLHPNFNGAEKISGYIGSFLKDHYEFRDVRDDRDYGYMKQQAAAYAEIADGAKLQFCEDLEEYLRIIDKDRYTVYLAAKNDAVSGLSDRDRELLASIGFTGLSDLSPSCSYAGIKDGSVIAADESTESEDDFIIIQGRINPLGRLIIDGKYNRSVKEGSYSPLKGEDLISVISAGSDAGNYAAISIDGKEYSPNADGLNFVVYDKELRQFADRAGFNTGTAEKQRTGTALPTEYTAKLERNELSTKNGFSDYLAEALSSGQNAVMIIGTSQEENDILTSEDISFMESLGLSAADKIQTQPYAALILNGEVIAEETGDPDLTVMGREPFFYLISSSAGGNTVITDKNRWDPENDSVFVLVSSPDGKLVIDRRTFN